MVVGDDSAQHGNSFSPLSESLEEASTAQKDTITGYPFLPTKKSEDYEQSGQMKKQKIASYEPTFMNEEENDSVKYTPFAVTIPSYRGDLLESCRLRDRYERLVNFSSYEVLVRTNISLTEYL